MVKPDELAARDRARRSRLTRRRPRLADPLLALVSCGERHPAGVEEGPVGVDRVMSSPIVNRLARKRQVDPLAMPPKPAPDTVTACPGTAEEGD